MRNGSRDLNVNIDCNECGRDMDIYVTLWTGYGDWDVDIPQVDCPECGEHLPDQRLEETVYDYVGAVLDDER